MFIIDGVFKSDFIDAAEKILDKSYIFHKPIPLLNIDRYWENFYRSYAQNILWGVKN